jgi:glyoxylase-like metal-dependent hydrolase (beta-lactamase superfamily II)
MSRQLLAPAPGITCYQEPFGPRLLNFYALEDAEGIILFDVGVPGSVQARAKAGELPQRITGAVISHADADHVGDGAWLQRTIPNTKLWCHPADRAMIENHDLLVHQRYDYARPRWGFGYPQDVLGALRAACGDNFTITHTLVEGDSLIIGKRQWRALHVPGHSLGHLALWAADEGILLLGDAVLGYGPPASGGTQPSIPPTHQHTQPYLDTIVRLADLDVRLALNGHWPPLDNRAFHALLDDSRQCVLRDLDLVTGACRREPHSFSGLLAMLNDAVRSWPPEADVHYFYALAGYLEHLVAAGTLVQQEDMTYVSR